MDLTFRFEKEFSPILGVIHRPIAQVFFNSIKKRKWYEVWMIVDTGADYTLLPKYYSKRLGVNLYEECKLFSTAGIGGEEKVYLLKTIKVKLGTWERSIPVGFLDRDDIPPLMGRYLFIETFDVFLSSNHNITFKSV